MRRLVGRRRVGAAVTITASIVLQSSLASASPAVGGNPAAIAFYRAVVATTQHQGGVDEVQTGFVVMKDSVAKGVVSANWTMGSGRLPAGYVPATEHLIVAATSGKISWASDRLTPVCKSAVCPDIPYEVLLTSSGLFGRLGNSSAVGVCWTPISGSLDYLKIGAPFGYSLVGTFAPLKRSGKTVVVTSTYPWSNNDSATEVDTVAGTTHLPTAGVVHVAAAVGQTAFQYRWTDKWLAGSPVQPKTRVCRTTK